MKDFRFPEGAHITIGSAYVHGRPIDPDPQVNREWANLQIKKSIVAGIEDVADEVRRVYYLYGITFARDTEPRGIARRLTEQVHLAIKSWQEYEKGGESTVQMANCPCTWSCYVATRGNRRATALCEAFNTKWTNADKKQYLMKTGVPFAELLKIALGNPHVMRELEAVERDRQWLLREALKKKVQSYLTSPSFTLSLFSIILLLVRPICHMCMRGYEPDEIYIYIRYSVAAIAIWQAIRLFRTKNDFYLAIALCFVVIVLNPFQDVSLRNSTFAWLYACMTIPFAWQIVSGWKTLK